MSPSDPDLSLFQIAVPRDGAERAINVLAADSTSLGSTIAGMGGRLVCEIEDEDWSNADMHFPVDLHLLASELESVPAPAP